MIKKVALTIAFVLGIAAPALAAKICTSNCADNTACDWNTGGSWTASGGATCPPDASDENWVIQAGDTITLNTDALNVGTGTLAGTLNFGTNMSSNVDATYGMRRLTITNLAGVPSIAVSSTGRLTLRASQGIIFDNAAGVAWLQQNTSGVVDIQGFTYDTTIKAIERVAATTASCGTTTGYQWLITPDHGFQYAKKFRRVLFKSGRMRTRQMEIVSVDPNDMCTGAGAPFSCCSGANAGTCTTGKSFAVCTNLIDPVATCAGADNPSTSGSGTTWCSGANTGLSLQRLTPHTSTIVYQTLGAGAVYRHPVPGYNPLGDCTGTDAPYEGCTGVGTGNKTVSDAQIYPAVGDQITIIDDVQFSSTTANNGYVIAPPTGSSSASVAPFIRAANFYGLGDPLPHRGIFYYPLTAGLSFNDILYNNFHEWVGQDPVKIRGFSNFKIAWNAVHDPKRPRASEADGALVVTPALATGSGGDANVTASADNVEMSDNWIGVHEGDGVSYGVSEASYPVYGTNIKILRNVIEGGCTKSITAGDANGTRTCNGVSLSACRGCRVAYNIIADSCSQDDAGAIVSGDGIKFAVTTTSTFSPTDVGYNNTLLNTVADHNWIVNSCEYGINTANSTTNAGQQVVSTHNYISHSRVVGIYGGRAYGNVIDNFGLLCNSTGTGIEYPIRTASNFLIGSDDTTDALCATAKMGVHMRNLGGNNNNTDVIMTDDIITRMDAANSYGIQLDTTVPYNVTMTHDTFDMDGTSLNSVMNFTSSDSSLGKTYSAADYTATHGNASTVSRCSTTVGLTDTFGASLLNTSSVAAESIIDNFDGNCSSTGTVTWGYDIYQNRANLDYNWPVGSPYLTAASSSAPFGARAFRFDRDSMNATMGGGLTWITPFPVNISNVSNVDTDGDGVIDLFDNCDLTFNPSQYDGDGDGKGCACDSSGDTCP